MSPDANQKKDTSRFRAASVSVVVGSAVCALKFAGFSMTGSYGILSDALESIINVAAALVAAYSLWEGSRKADMHHPYGRGRMEYFSAGFEGALILLAGLLILYESIPRILQGNKVEKMEFGLIFTGVGTLANLLLGMYLLRAGKTGHSLALVADGKHVLSDVISSVGLFVGLIFVHITHLPWLDPALGAMMGVVILISGFKLVKQSYFNLMDRVNPEIVKQVVDALREAKTPEMIKPHKLRIRESGSHLLIDFHLIVPRYFVVGQLHHLEEKIHATLTKSLDRPVDLLLHNDPCTPKECGHCSVKRCPVRSRQKAIDLDWEPGLLMKDVEHKQRRHSI